jgi:G-patch domain
MSKPISISFDKPKTKATAPSSAPIPAAAPTKEPAFTVDADEDDETAPTHEFVLGFAADGGAILSTPVQRKEEKVIENQGNADWRTRGRPVTAASQQQQQQQQDEAAAGVAGTVETDEASKKAGLQFAESSISTTTAPTSNGQLSQHQNGHHTSPASPPESSLTQDTQSTDQVALSALLNGDNARSSSSTTIIPQSQSQPQTYGSAATKGDETLDFRADVASRPDAATLADYAAMPVEEFGMALLRGMGKKRRANGEVIVIRNPNEPEDEKEKKKKVGKERDPNAGFLGIGAKAVKIVNGGGNGSGEDGLGAWGKAEMRKSGKGGKAGEGLYTPVMLRDRRTGELITERELEERRQAAKERETRKMRAGGQARDEEDWRHRRDRNLDRNGLGRRKKLDRDNGKHGHAEAEKDGYAENLNNFSRKMIEDNSSSSSKKEETNASSSASRHSSASRRTSPSRHDRPRDLDRDTDEKYRHRHRDEDYRERERDRERNGRDEKYRDRDRECERERRRDRCPDDDGARYDSSASSAAARRNGTGSASASGYRGRDRYDDDHRRDRRGY